MLPAPGSDPGPLACLAGLTAASLAALGHPSTLITLLQAMRQPARLVFIGSWAALAAHTILSLGLGSGLETVLPAGAAPWLTAVLLLGFGLRLIFEAEDLPACGNGREPQHTGWAVIAEVFALVFVTELGDHPLLSAQLGTVALTTVPAIGSVGLLAASFGGQALGSGLAVTAGRWIGRRIPGRALYRLGGGLFLVFGQLSLEQMLR